MEVDILREFFKYLNNRKSKGNIAVFMTFLWIFILIIVLSSFLLERYLLNIKAQKTKDAIVFSNLAIYKNLDLAALGDIPSKFAINDPYAALNTFTSKIEENMNLDTNMVAKTNSVATGQVKIKYFNIYNIDGNTCKIYSYDSVAKIFVPSTVADITATPVVCPSGQTVTKTSVYSCLEFDIDFMLKGILGSSKTVNAGALTDIRY